MAFKPLFPDYPAVPMRMIFPDPLPPSLTCAICDEPFTISLATRIEMRVTLRRGDEVVYFNGSACPKCAPPLVDGLLACGTVKEIK